MIKADEDMNPGMAYCNIKNKNFKQTVLIARVRCLAQGHITQ